MSLVKGQSHRVIRWPWHHVVPSNSVYLMKHKIKMEHILMGMLLWQPRFGFTFDLQTRRDRVWWPFWIVVKLKDILYLAAQSYQHSKFVKYNYFCDDNFISNVTSPLRKLSNVSSRQSFGIEGEDIMFTFQLQMATAAFWYQSWNSMHEPLIKMQSANSLRTLRFDFEKGCNLIYI